MKIVSFNLTPDGARTLVKRRWGYAEANITGCHYKVDDVDEVTHAWRCSDKHATLATNVADAFNLRTITYLKSSAVQATPAIRWQTASGRRRSRGGVRSGVRGSVRQARILDVD